MLPFGLLILCVTSALGCSVEPSIPQWFKMGVSTSAYQIEGAWNVSDKGLNIYDVFTHNTTGAIKDNSTGDVACDSYHLWRRDIEMASELGLDFYRFSISWSRLLPHGLNYHVSEDGVEYYNNLINGLLERGIEPMVTLYHWDLPETLQQLGGWANPLITDWFADYARLVFYLFGDRVKTWITINEPIIMCDIPYTSGMLPPRVDEPYLAPFLCTKHVLLAHAKAWRIYHEEFKPLYGGRVSISNHVIWYEAKEKGDEQLAELTLQYMVGRFAHAIFSKKGGWHPALEKTVAEVSKKMGFARSRLPPFTTYEKNLVRGSYDFLALNYYTANLVRPANKGEKVENFFLTGVPDLGAVLEHHPTATYGLVSAVAIYPEGLRRILNWLKSSYGDIEMVITENGFSSGGSDLNDYGRINYIRNHMEQILLAIKNDHVRVTGYTHWSLMDNFEWMDGYTSKFGLYEVNFTDPHRTRTPRASAKYYSHLIDQRVLDICQ